MMTKAMTTMMTMMTTWFSYGISISSQQPHPIVLREPSFAWAILNLTFPTAHFDVFGLVF